MPCCLCSLLLCGGNNSVYTLSPPVGLEWKPCTVGEYACMHRCTNGAVHSRLVSSASWKLSSIEKHNIWYQWMDIEIVESYKYKGVDLNNKLDWTDNTNALERTEQTLPAWETQVFWRAGALQRTFLTLWWHQPCSMVWSAGAEASRLLTGWDSTDWWRRSALSWDAPPDPVEVVLAGRTMTAKLSSLMENMSHPIHATLTALGSSFSARLLHQDFITRLLLDHRKRLTIHSCGVSLHGV